MVVMSISPGDLAVAPPIGLQQARDAPNLARLRPIFQLREAKRDCWSSNDRSKLARAYELGCPAQTVTVPGADGKDQTINIVRC
jgi:hypothetical protein